MIYALGALCFSCVAGILFCMWGFVCNERCYRQRRRLIDYAFSQPDYRPLIADYEAVSYDRHEWALIKLKSPWKLYGGLLGKALGEGRIIQ